MWATLDVTIFATTIAAKRSYTLAFSYAVGAGAVFLAHLKMGAWEWTWIETLSAIGVALSVIIWQKFSADYGTIAGVSAMNIAGIPIMVMLWVHPDPQTFWLFMNTTIACGLTLAGIRPWTMRGSFLAWSGLIYNGAMVLIVLR